MAKVERFVGTVTAVKHPAAPEGLVGTRVIVYEGSTVLAKLVRLSPEARAVVPSAGAYLRRDYVEVDVHGPVEFDRFEVAVS